LKVQFYKLKLNDSHIDILEIDFELIILAISHTQSSNGTIFAICFETVICDTHHLLMQKLWFINKNSPWVEKNKRHRVVCYLTGLDNEIAPFQFWLARSKAICIQLLIIMCDSRLCPNCVPFSNCLFFNWRLAASQITDNEVLIFSHTGPCFKCVLMQGRSH
jgi:hypothetical protein